MGLSQLKASTVAGAVNIPAAPRFKLEELILPEAVQVNGPNGRYYVTPSGAQLPSITTILSKYNHDTLDAWRERVGDVAADAKSAAAAFRGENMHKCIEDYLRNKDVKYNGNPLTKEMFLKAKRFIDQQDIVSILGIEKKLYSETLGVAGTCDFIVELGNGFHIGTTPYIIDWKTSSYFKDEKYIQNYFLQLTAYSLMYEEMTGRVINNCAIVIACENEVEVQVEWFVRDRYILDLLKAIKHYKETVKNGNIQ